jgi:Fe-S cluster biosynthesis and repair protein YggX
MKTNIFLEIFDELSSNAWNKWAKKQAKFSSTKLKKEE